MHTTGWFFIWGGVRGMRYDKPWLSLEEQADLLAQRSLEGDRAVVIEHLRDVGYYRLSGYWHVFKDEDDSFRPGTTFDRVWGLYVFDRQLRLTTLDAIERVEVFMRSRLAYYLADKTGVFGYLERPALPRLSQEEYLSFLKRCMDCYGRSREPFADHFRKVYGDECGMPPYWVMVNLMEMGLLLRLYKGASCDIRGEIASEVDVTATVLDSWLVALNTVRNICAHHSRLWNRPFGTRPMIPRAKNDARWHEPYKVESDRIFGVLTILSCLLEVIAPDTSWRCRLFAQLEGRTEMDMLSMGFRPGWQECPFWKPWMQDVAWAADRQATIQ